MELKFSLFKLDFSTIIPEFTLRILGISLFFNRIERFGPRYLLYVGWYNKEWMVDLFFIHVF